MGDKCPHCGYVHIVTPETLWVPPRKKFLLFGPWLPAYLFKECMSCGREWKTQA